MAEVTDSERLERIFRDHYPAVLGYARRRVAAPVADDVAAETFAVAWRRSNAIPKDPLPWLLGVARRVLATQRRAAARRLRLAQRLETNDQYTDESPIVGGQIGEALAALSEKDREAILLVAWDGLTAKQAAIVVGLSASGFSVRLHRARRRLRTQLQSPCAATVTALEVNPVLHKLPATKGDRR
jgi:RNA polymerase sigma-70 factor (ECF subfamily)